MSEVVVALSGGMDSATVLAKALAEGCEVIPVGFNYPSKHNKWEQGAARNFVSSLYNRTGNTGVINNYRVIDLTSLFNGFESNLLRGGDSIPEGHYEAENMKQTVVPGRNIIFASVLAGLAWSLEASEVWLGIHAGDHYIYPDCRPAFFHSMNIAIREGTDGNVELKAPFLMDTKVEILQAGIELGVPYELTRTCYKDQKIACGKCGSCQERLSAFKKLGIEDPLEYESRELLPK